MQCNKERATFQKHTVKYYLRMPVWAPSGCSTFLLQSRDLQVGNSTSHIGVNVSMNGCLSLCIGPVMNSEQSRLYPTSHPVPVGIGSSPPPSYKVTAIKSQNLTTYFKIPWSFCTWKYISVSLSTNTE